MKTAIVYASIHHGNTEKLVKAISKKYPDIMLIDSTKTVLKDLSGYDLIGFASGIYFSKFHKSLISFINDNLPLRKKTFLLYTCGAEHGKAYTTEIKNLIASKECTVVGTYSCPGYDTFGPFKLIGGLQKCHPTAEELEKAVEFFDDLIK